MVEGSIELFFFIGWLTASIWLIIKAFREKKEDAALEEKGKKIKGLRWGFKYQFLLGLLNLFFSSAGFFAALYLLVRDLRS